MSIKGIGTPPTVATPPLPASEPPAGSKPAPGAATAGPQHPAAGRVAVSAGNRASAPRSALHRLRPERTKGTNEIAAALRDQLAQGKIALSQRYAQSSLHAATELASQGLAALQQVLSQAGAKKR
jgi:hypothetical protein